MVGPLDWRDDAVSEWAGNPRQLDWSPATEERGSPEPRRALRMVVPYPATAQGVEVLVRSVTGGIEITLAESEPDAL